MVAQHEAILAEQAAQRRAASVAAQAAAEPAAGHLADDSSDRMFTLDLRTGQPGNATEEQETH